ncbi:hypothetical protein M0R45_006171 [Rubus argutus]|uniref:Agglutinin domain-containing protein n=1 Tax=Rubus argutus TaxID=59490 RepID=A0AAW1YQC7_RUBAR
MGNIIRTTTNFIFRPRRTIALASHTGDPEPNLMAESSAQLVLDQKIEAATTELGNVPGSSASTSLTPHSNKIEAGCENKQGDVVTDVGGDFIKDVHGYVTYCEKQIRLPRFVVLKAKYNRKYLRLTKNDDGALPAGFIKFDAREAVSPQAKFELEMAKSGHGLVHIRCCHNNKYLVRPGTQRWIVAAAHKPEENKSKISCTLFEPEPVNNSGGLEFRFRHIQLGMYACLWRAEIPFYGGLYGGSRVPDQDECDVYTVIDWESLGDYFEKKMKQAVVLPRFVALKGMYNDKYLILRNNHPRLPAGFMKFDGEEVASPLAKFEVEMAKSGNGLIHIRCCYNNKYLVREGHNENWIVAAADKPMEDENEISCTLFEPEPYDENGGLEFRFYHIQLGMYACLWRAEIPFYGGLYAGSSTPDKDACDVYTVVDLNC